MPQKRKHIMIKVEIVKLPTPDSKRIKLSTMGNNDCGELGLGYDVKEMKYPRHVESLADFNIVKISCGSLHIAALTRDRKVITWGALERVTKSEDPNATDENVPVFAQGLDDVVIVKIICSSNIILALSDKGQLYAFRTFRDNNRKTGFTLGINKQSMFVNYGPTSHLKITDITVGENHTLVLTTNSYLYTFGCIDSYQLGRRISICKSNGLILTSVKILSLIREIFARGNHIRIFQKLNQSEPNFHGASPYLVLLENGKVYSFSSTKYGQLGIGVLEGNRKSPVRINLNNCKLIATRNHHSMAVDDENKVYTWGFGGTYALGNQRENNELLPFKIKGEEFGEIIDVGE
ncbi:1682_t:CDS:2, partial [Gigaspora margarita]